MPSMRGFLRSKPKSDDAEGELAESQLVARLAGLFGELAVDTAESAGQQPAQAPSNGAHNGASNGLTIPREAALPGRTSGGTQPTERSRLGRPPIIVIGEAPIIIPGPEAPEDESSAGDEPSETLGRVEPVEPELLVEPIGVMAQAGDDVGEDTWQLPARPDPMPLAKPARKRPSRARRAPAPEASVATARPAELDVAPPVIEPEIAAARESAPEVASAPELEVPPAAAEVEDAPVRIAQLALAQVFASEAARPVDAAPATSPAKRSHKKRPAAVAVVQAKPVVQPKPVAQVEAVAVVTPVAKPTPVVRAKAAPKARLVLKAKPVLKARPVVISAVHCPYCGVLLDPPPASSRKCEECQQRIIVKRIDGRAVYLAGAALPVFAAERRRVANSARLTRERSRWLELASTAGAPSRAVAQLRIARASDASVTAARELYLLAVDRTVRQAKRDKEWEAAARLRREEATAIQRADGSPRPPSAEVVGLYRDGVASELRGIAEISRDAQLVAAPCCEACRADDEVVTRIATELRQPRLPHADCPKGLCRCHWDLAARDRTTLLRYLRRRSPSASRTSTETPPAR